MEKSAVGAVEKVYEIPEKIKAPVAEGDAVGRISYRIGDETIGESEIYAVADVGKITFGEIFLRLIQNILIGG